MEVPELHQFEIIKLIHKISNLLYPCRENFNYYITHRRRHI